MIELRNVSKSYRTGEGPTHVLQRIDLTIRSGEFVTIMGPSGAGKSTLLSILGMMDTEFGGEYHFRDHPIRAIVTKPTLLLADEPTGNLHSKQGKEIMDLFKELHDEGVTIVRVTRAEENAAYGSRIVQLRDGWIESDTGSANVGTCAPTAEPA